MNIVYCIYPYIFYHKTNEIDVETKNFIRLKFNHWTYIIATKPLTSQLE